jgi:HSP20 family protein
MEDAMLSTLPLTVPKRLPKSMRRRGERNHPFVAPHLPWGTSMITAFTDPLDTLFNLQRALQARIASDWLQDHTTSQGPFPPINVFQQGDDFLAIVELPGIDKDSLQIQAKENSIRISGKKNLSYPEAASVHRHERLFGEFDRTLSLPVQLDPDGIKADYQDGILALFLPRAERDRPRTIKIS